ncbi:MAG: response regulator [Lacunisphaera sp.]
MVQPLTILIAEDDPHDAELMLRELRRAGFDPQWTRVDTEKDYIQNLNLSLDLVISDYEMPQFDCLRALELLKASGLEIPFIIISGTIGEDTAVQAMKMGASDYLLKDRLARLEQAVRHALAQTALRLEREQVLKTLRESEEKLRHIFDGISAFVGLFSGDGVVLELNQAALLSAGADRAGIIGRPFIEGPWWSHSVEMRKRISQAIARAKEGFAVNELLAVVAGDREILVEASFRPLRDATGTVGQIVASGIDVTERNHAERRIQEQLDELLRWQNVMVDREDRVQALKQEVNELLARQNQPGRYVAPQSP